MLKKAGLSDNFLVFSSATSTEEIGNPVHIGTKSKLAQHGISVNGKYAVRLKKSDYDEYDYIIGMNSYNIKNIIRITGADTQSKLYKLLDFSEGGDIADPWYTGNFDETYNDICRGCTDLLKQITNLHL